MASAGHPQMPGEEMPGEEGPCYFSILAPELVDNILCEIDSVDSLKSFISTSRFVYRRFECRKKVILACVLRNELGPVIVDAQCLRMFPYAGPGGDQECATVYLEGVHSLVAKYQEMRACARRGAGGDGLADLSFVQLTEFCHTYRRMGVLACIYIEVQRRSFGGVGPAGAWASRTELLRVLRALYRRQFITNAERPLSRKFPSAEDETTASSTDGEWRDMRLDLLTTFEPWELQQVDHLDFFVTRLCAALILAARQAGQPISDVDAEVMSLNAERVMQYIQHHPDIMTAALRIVESVRRQSSTKAPKTDITNTEFFISHPLICLQLAWPCRLYRFPTGAGERRRQQGQEDDGGTTVDIASHAIDLAPFGWLDALDGRCIDWVDMAELTSFYGMALHDDETFAARHSSLQLWRDVGFTLWDQGRVEAIKELDWLQWPRFLFTGWAVY